jgi:ATP-dependent Lon protease
VLKQAFLLPLRDVVVYPHMVIPLFVGRDKSIRALELAMAGSREILLVAQKKAENDDPDEASLYSVGTLATILQLLRLPDGTIKVLVEGNQRVSIQEVVDEDDYLLADIASLEEPALAEDANDALVKLLLQEFEHYCQLSKKISNEVFASVSSINDLSHLVDTIASHMPLKLGEKQEILEIAAATKRAEHLISMMVAEQDVMRMEKRIRGRVKQQMEKSQREYYLNEQIKAIQKELGDLDDGGGSEIDVLEKKIAASGMSKEAREKARAELGKLKLMSPMSAEATVVRGYLDWITSLPWKKRSKVSNDLRKAQEILDADHYGLEEVKERILEFLAVQARVGKVRGPILCLVGPPGVGKTSLGQSIARATNRKFVRMALGGVRDEAEIRGHRRTYIGSMPGKIVQKMVKSGVKNPLFLLDEVDKMGMDMRGDPASALLEVLDPEQNGNFSDHYLEVDYDLSEALFICTSNSMNIPPALLDRMEIIRIPGYTEDEKINIARQYLLPRQLEANGLSEEELALDDAMLRDIVRYYTREAGVRELERQLAKISRKHLKQQLLSGKKDSFAIDNEGLEACLGVRRYDYGRAEEKDQVGQVTGLAWTSVGGELLTIEAASVPGKGRVTTTGSLGDVMQESIQAALTVVKSRAAPLGIRQQTLELRDFHVHVPEGATPKDGPSAGIAMCCALVSVLTNIKVHANVAMTGEITLRGQVLPIGGLKEKLLAAHRGAIKMVIIPEGNAKDLKEIPDNIKAELDIRPVKWVDQVLELALDRTPVPLTDAEIQEEQVWAERKRTKIDEERVSTH